MPARSPARPEVQKDRPSVAVHGCYNTPNFGDQLLLDLARRAVADAGGEPVSPWVHGVPDTAGLAWFAAALRCDVALFAGGGYLVDAAGRRDKRRLLRYSVPATAWRWRGTPRAVIGVGVGPHLSPFGRRRVAEVCRGAEVVAARDEASAELLRASGVDDVRVTADWVVGLERRDLPPDAVSAAEATLPDGPRRFGLHLPLPAGKADAAHAICRQAAEALRGVEDVEVIFLFDHGVTPTGRELATRWRDDDTLPPSRLVHGLPHWSFAAVLARLDAVLTVKLHVGITAWALGVPPCSLYAHGKTGRFYEQIGRDDRARPLAEADGPVTRWLTLFRDDPAAFGGGYDDHRDRLRAAARENVELTRAFVGRDL